MSTRLMLQHEMQIGNSSCDENMLCCIGACECFACVVSMADPQYGDLAHTLADGLYYGSCACMQTQHKIQLDARDMGKVVTFAVSTVTTVAPIVPQGMYASPMPQQQVMYGQPQPQMGYAQQPQMGYAQPQQMGYAQQQQYAPPPQQFGQPQYAPPGQGQMMMGQGQPMGPPGGKRY